MQNLCPIFAVFQIELGLGLVAGGNPDIPSCALRTGLLDRIVGIGERNSGLAAFLDDFEEGMVNNPIVLVLEEIAARPKIKQT